ncbi:MAG: hypothetical protein HFG15_04020 [Bacilli bacterium]|jgi:hypothetical protein|nr:hypothetical protein [Bacilli bacterium]
MKILKRKKQDDIRAKSMLQYYIPDRDKFNFYLYEAGFELLDMTEQQGIVTETPKNQRHYVSYWIKKLEEVDPYPIEVVLKLVTAKKKQPFHQTAKGIFLPIHRVTLYSPDYMECTDYFTLDSTFLEKNENNLYQAYCVIANNNYVYSRIDGKNDTPYKKIIYPNKQ